MHWVKCTIGGGYRGNLGPNSVAFCIIDSRRDFIFAKGIRIEDTTNIMAESKSIREKLMHCIDNTIASVIIESDFMALVQIL